MNHSEIVSFIWSVADLIRDSFRRGRYQDVILPLTVLRRLDCVLAPTKERVLEVQARYKGQIENLDPQLCQDWYRDFARTMGEQPLSFIGSVAPSDDTVATAARIRDTLHFDVEERRHLPTWTDALRRFVDLADALGVLVMVSGVVGSNNHRRLDPTEFRGFALADPLAPLIFINGADTKAAQMFTLAHEMAHLWLGQSAVSDAEASAISDHALERWCNEVAAELLVPIASISDTYEPAADLRLEVDRLARRFKVSTFVILRRIYDSGGLTRDEFRSAYDEELARLRALPKGDGGSFYLTLGARVSKRFARALVTTTLEGRTSFTECFRLLGVRKMSTFHDVADSLGVGY